MRFPIILTFALLVAACCSPSLSRLKDAAGQGDVDAQLRLAERYFVGDRVTQDSSKAVYWFKKAGEQGHQYGFYRLGQIHEFGHGVTPDIRLAEEYYEKSARLNGADAQDALAWLHMSGALGERNYRASYTWQVLAARHNGLMFKAGNYGAEKHLSPPTKKQALRAANVIAQGF